MRTHINRYPMPAHTYHVDATNGVAGQSGAADKPIQTIAEVNALALKPGDRVLFKAGETWSGTRFRPTASGSPGRHILYGAYGAGALPIIQAGDAGAANQAVYIDKAFLTLKDLYLKYGGDNLATLQTNGACGLVVDGCTVEGDTSVLADGIGLFGGSYDVLIRNTTVFNAKVSSGGGGGITSTAGRNIRVEDCTVRNCGTSATLDHGIYFTAIDGLILQRNVVYSNTAHGITFVNTLNGAIEGNTCYSNGEAGIWISGTSNAGRVVNNLVYSNVGYGIAFNNNMACSMLIAHNTIYNSTFNFHFSTGVTGVTLKNNVSYESVSTRSINIKDAAILENNTFTNNCYKRTTGSFKPFQINGSTSYTLAEWQALTGTPEANSLDADPVFVTTASDWHLQTTSPCKAAGDATVGVLTDKDGVVRGVANDIGCYEFV